MILSSVFSSAGIFTMSRSLTGSQMRELYPAYGQGGLSVGTKYYRIASKAHPVGHVFKGHGVLPLAAYTEVEDALGRNKPTASPSRDDCTYMRPDKDFSAVGVDYDDGCVHEVEPVGPVEQRDIYWIGVLVKRHSKSPQMRADLEPALTDDEVAERYWNGSASKNPTWEWVAKEATVISVDPTLVPVRPNAPMYKAFNDALKKK